jgi:hypothetical protein
MPHRAWNDAERFLLRAIRGDAAWPTDVATAAVLDEAAFHGVLPLLFHAVRDARAWAEWPRPAQITLADAARHHAAVELADRREVTHVLDALAGHGIPALLLKGAVLAHTLYPEPWLRARADTDLLIPEARRQAVFDLLEQQGYRRAESAGGEFASAEASFGRDGAALPLDVHWRISNSPLLAPMFDFDEMSARAVPVAALGPHARGLGLVDAALLAATHRAAHHQSPLYVDGRARRGDRLIWLHDLHLLVARLTPAQLGELAQRATHHRSAGLCRDALRATHEAFGTPLPGALMEELERAAAHDEPSMVLLRGGRRRVLLAELRALRGWTERARWLREHALPPGDYMLRKYHTRRRWLLPALYVRRALGWLAR